MGLPEGVINVFEQIRRGARAIGGGEIHQPLGQGDNVGKWLNTPIGQDMNYDPIMDPLLSREGTGSRLSSGYTKDLPNTPSQDGLSKADKDKLMAGAGFAPLLNGHYYNQQTKEETDANGNIIEQGAKSTAAGDAANYAQAGMYGAQAEKLREDMARDKLTYEGIQAGTLYATSDPNIFYTPDGHMVDKGDLKVKEHLANIEQGKLDLDTRNAIFNNANTETLTRLRQQEVTGNQALERSRLDQEGAYQKGQLAQGDKRLQLEASAQAQDYQIKAQQNALAKQQYIGKVLSSPSDFIARAFMQRGQASPNTPITQGDLINQINSEYNANPVAYAAPQTNPGQPNLGMPTYANGTVDSGGPGSSNVDPNIDPRIKKEQGRLEGIAKLLQHVTDADTQHRLVDELAQGRSRLSPPAMATGSYGTVNDKQAIVGDPQVPGKPNPEMVLNPTGAPIAVVPMNRLGGAKGYANGTPGNMNTQYSNGFNNNFGSYDSTSGKPLAGRISLGGSRDPNNPYMSPSVGVGTRGSISGNGILSDWDTPDRAWYQNYLQEQAALTPKAPGSPVYTPPPDPAVAAEQARLKQEQIVNTAETNLPPALQQLFGGGSQVGVKPRLTTGGTNNPLNPTGVDPLKFGFNLFSPQALSQLTTAEQEALQSYLGVKYNTTLEDVATAMQQTFGRQEGRRGRLVSG